MYHNNEATERYSNSRLLQPPPPAYQLKIVRRLGNGEILSRTCKFPTLAGLHRQQGKIMSRAEELGQAVATTAIVNGQARLPRISSHYLAVWEGSVA